MTRGVSAGGWQVWIDTGGTFTDCVARDAAGRLHRAKVLSNSSLRGTVRGRLGRRRLEIDIRHPVPSGFLVGGRCRILGSPASPTEVVEWDGDDGTLELADDPGEAQLGSGLEIGFAEEAPLLAARLVTGTPAGQPLPPIQMRLATTRGTNALLERTGAPLALFITRGFGDLLKIGNQQRPDLFALDIRRPKPLYRRVVEVEERLAADGMVLRELDRVAVERQARELFEQGFEVAAVALAHSYRNPRHERQVAEALIGAGFAHVSCSSDLAPFAGLLPRAETAVVDAYLGPIVDDYLSAVAETLDGGTLHVMTSAGGLVRAADYRARDSLLSGPAGGVVGAAQAGRKAGSQRVIAFDMGGTSTDAARIDGEFEYLYETRVGDVRLLAPTLAIETVAAGGGSICSFDGERLRVGPESSGADPGPACYGAGGPLSLTDVNLLLGRLDPQRFEIPIDRDKAASEARSLWSTMVAAEGGKNTLEALLEGLLQIADERMAEAIRTISVRCGYDPRDYTLVAFGGAGGQHACSVAELLGISTVLVPADASLLSAQGLGGARIERFAQRQVLAPLDGVATSLPAWFDELSARAVAAVASEGIEPGAIEVRRRRIGLRLTGQDSTLEVEYRTVGSIAPDFAAAYLTIYGYLPGDRALEVEAIRVVAGSGETTMEVAAASPPEPLPAVAGGTTEAYLSGSWRSISWFERRDLPIGARLVGPALVFERHSTTTIPAGWRLRVEPTGALRLRRSPGGSAGLDAPGKTG